MLTSEQVGDYQLVRLLSDGGMGSVYEGFDTVLGRRAAVKVLREDLNGENSFRRRFLREAQILAGLKHPNITRVYDSGTCRDGRLFLALEYVEGSTLEECLTTGIYANPYAALLIARQLCAALDYAHRQGVVHRDIKPANIMIRPDGTVVLMDFGIARLRGHSGLTQAGQAMGTPEYMSPEQCRGARVGRRSDIYSLGIVIYEMLTGMTPFTGRSPLAVIERQVHNPPPSILRLAPGLPRHMARAIHKALDKNPARRQRSAVEFLYELLGLSAGRSASSRRGLLANAAARYRGSRLGRILYLVAAVVLAGILALIIYQTSHAAGGGVGTGWPERCWVVAQAVIGGPTSGG